MEMIADYVIERRESAMVNCSEVGARRILIWEEDLRLGRRLKC
jgi:hypothetical protein